MSTVTVRCSASARFPLSFPSAALHIRAFQSEPLTGMTHLAGLESLSRVNFFGDLAYNLPLLKIVAEIGHATGGTVETYNSFSGGRADQSYTYGSLGIRLSW